MYFIAKAMEGNLLQKIQMHTRITDKNHNLLPTLW